MPEPIPKLKSPSAQDIRRSAETDHSVAIVDAPKKFAEFSENRGFGTSTSSIEFARTVLGNEGAGELTKSSLIPGDGGYAPSHDQPWSLHVIQLPPDNIMEDLINKYFHSYHWYICLFNEHSFRQMANQVLRTRHCWQRKDLSDVVTVLTVALVGLQTGLADASWSAIPHFRLLDIDPEKLLRDISTELRHHIIDIVEDSKLEAVQVCLLLATFHVYHDSPNLAWTIATMGVSVAYALGLQYPKYSTGDPAIQQIRSRCWNHTMVADTFGLVVYGRPGLIDPGTSGVHELLEMEETISDPLIVNHATYGRGNQPTTMTFHVLKGKLYRIIRHALDRFRVLQQSHQASGHIESLIQTAQEVQGLLTQYRSKLPPLFEWDNWKHSDPWKHAEDGGSPGQGGNPWRKLLLQATMLQVLYNGAVILAHRPLLEYKISFLGQSKPTRFVLESLRSSLDTAVRAALLISQTQVQRLEGQFCISFFFMHLFTAGVILSMAPASQPLSSMSQQAKAGIVRILRATKQVGGKNRIAQHTDKLLSELLHVTLQREMENALKAESADVTDDIANEAQRFHMDNDLPILPAHNAQNRQLQGIGSNNPTQDQPTYPSEVFDLLDPGGLTTQGEVFLDTRAIPFHTSAFPGNIWPFRGFEDVNENFGGFQESE